MTTLSQWEDVDVATVDGMPKLDPTDYDDPGWDSVVFGRVIAREPLWLSTMEFEPVDTQPVLPSPGEYEVLLLARSVESVIRWITQVLDEPTEQHFLMFRRVT